MKSLTWAAVLVVSVTLVQAGKSAEKSVTWTGWFTDAKCHEALAPGVKVSAPNPDCSKDCLEKGATAIFLSQQANAIYQVKGYSGVIDDLGYRLEVQAKVDEAARTITIQSVKRLEYEGAACSRPRKTVEVKAFSAQRR